MSDLIRFLLHFVCIVALHFGFISYVLADSPISEVQKQLLADVTRVISERPEAVHDRDSEGFTMLYKAAYLGHEKVVEYLLKSGADIDQISGNTLTALNAAAQGGCVDTATVLIENGANLNIPDRQGCTPLCTSIFEGHTPVALLLIQKKADVQQATKKGVYPIHAAAQKGFLDVAEAILSTKEDVNRRTKNSFGVTPLQDAALEGRLEMVKFLLKMGADPNAVSYNGFTPADDAILNQHAEVLSVLKAHGAKTIQELLKCDTKEETVGLQTARANALKFVDGVNASLQARSLTNADIPQGSPALEALKRIEGVLPDISNCADEPLVRRVREFHRLTSGLKIP